MSLPSKTLLVLFFLVPVVAFSKVKIPDDAKFRRLVRRCPGLMSELKKTAKGFNDLARKERVSTVTLQGNFNKIVVDIAIILEEGSRKKCERSFKSVWYHRDEVYDHFDYRG